jgi:shikimate dehydrogenase
MSAGTVRRACVMGHPIAHSRSPLIHNHWLATLGIPGRYDRQDVAPDAFETFLAQLAAHGYVGGNVTVPHKATAFRLVARRDAVAEAVGAVNTVWLEGGRLVGGNSDVHGFVANLDERTPDWSSSRGRAVVLGAGGAAHSAAYALIRRGFTIALVNRSREHAQDLAAHFGTAVTAHAWDGLPALLPAADLLVNCTSCGMQGKPPLAIDLGPLPVDAIVCDVVYVPLETPLLAEARRRGHRAVDGLGMLLHQAGFGFEKWFGVMPTVTAELRALVETDIRARSPAASWDSARPGKGSA